MASPLHSDTEPATTSPDDWPRLVVEAAPNAVLMINQARRIVLVNRAAESLFGFSRNELVGEPVELLVPKRYQAIHPQHVAAFFSSPKARAMGAGRELFGRHRDGAEIPIEIGLNPIETSTGVFTLASIIDITERKREQERFRLVVEAAPNAMILVDADRRITMVNRSVESLFGYSREELVGQPIESLVPERFREIHPRHVLGFHNQPRARAMGVGRDLYGRCKDGSEVPVEIGLNPIDTADGRFTLASITDITERQHAAELKIRSAGLELENRRIQEVSRLKSEFLANMSHELRTPLNAIIGFSALLDEHRVDPHSAEYKEFVGHILAGGRHLLQLINDVLDLSKVEAGKIVFHPEWVSLRRLIDEVVASLSAISAEREVTVSVDHEPAVDRVYIDPQRFKQILYNYFSNALKFTAEGGRVVIRTRSGGEGFFRLEVEDDGVGISAGDLGKLFVEFQQLEAGTRKRHQGTGLGLALTKHLVQAQGGQVGVTSQIGVGSCFFAQLPEQTSVQTAPS